MIDAVCGCWAERGMQDVGFAALELAMRSEGGFKARFEDGFFQLEEIEI